jgi:hypothetical protein
LFEERVGKEGRFVSHGGDAAASILAYVPVKIAANHQLAAFDGVSLPAH